MPHLTSIFGDEASGLRELGTQMTPTLGCDLSFVFFFFSMKLTTSKCWPLFCGESPPVSASVISSPAVFLLLVVAFRVSSSFPLSKCSRSGVNLSAAVFKKLTLRECGRSVNLN